MHYIVKVVFMELAEWVDDPELDPDLQKVTESVDHREAVDLIALSATLLMPDDLRVVRDLNWYPTDDRSVFLAPDIMVVPRMSLGEHAKSYRQMEMGGGPPLVALEVPSHTNTVPKFSAKIRRINSYGVVAYVVEVDPEAQAILRYEAPSIAPTDWAGRPIPELGGIMLDFADDALRCTNPDGLVATSFDEIVTANVHRAEELETKLRALGHDPDRE